MNPITSPRWPHSNCWECTIKNKGQPKQEKYEQQQQQQETVNESVDKDDGKRAAGNSKDNAIAINWTYHWECGMYDWCTGINTEERHCRSISIWK